MPIMTKATAETPEKVIVFGKPKSGKTYLTGLLAEHKKLIWLDLERGATTLRQLPLAWQENVDLWTVNDSPADSASLNLIKSIIRKKVNVCHKHSKVECVTCKKNEEPFSVIDLPNSDTDTVLVIDSLTGLSESTLNHVLKQSGLDITSKGEITFNHYGLQGSILSQIMAYIVALPCHVVCISHEKNIEEEATKKEFLTPIFGTKNLSRNVAKDFGHVVYCYVSNKKHKIMSRTSDATNKIVGSRTDVDCSSIGTIAPLLGIKIDGVEVNKAATDPVTPTVATGQTKKVGRLVANRPKRTIVPRS